MKLQKLTKLVAAALVCGLLMAAPLSASAAIGDGAAPAHSGYLVLSEDQLDIEIPADETSVTEYVYVQYAEDNYNFVTWSTSNASVATVDNGAITAWGQGSAIISAKTDTGAVARCLVSVTKQDASRLNRTFLHMNIEYNNRTPREQLYLASSSGYDSVYQWRSSNPSVASVDRNGVVTAYAEGVTNIYANTVRGATLTCTVTVMNNIGRVTLNESRLYLESIGAQGALTASVAVENPAAVPITWTSSNPAAATVDGAGIVTAVGDGEAIITATTPEGKSDTCKVYTGAVGAQKRQEAESFFGLGGLFQDIFD